MMTASQLNTLDSTEQRIGTVTVAGDEMTWIVDSLPLHVSFSFIVPKNSNLKVSEMTSVEGMELALIVIDAVHIRPITCDDLPNRSVSRDITESSGMMK